MALAAADVLIETVEVVFGLYPATASTGSWTP
jgi:hypothetical protein